MGWISGWEGAVVRGSGGAVVLVICLRTDVSIGPRGSGEQAAPPASTSPMAVRACTFRRPRLRPLRFAGHWPGALKHITVRIPEGKRRVWRGPLSIRGGLLVVALQGAFDELELHAYRLPQ